MIIDQVDIKNIRKTLSILCDDDNAHEVRVPDTDAGILAGWYRDREQQAWTILNLTLGRGKYPAQFGPKSISPPSSVYMMLNPVGSDFLSVSGNAMKSIGKGEGSKDEDVVRLKRLYLDFDPWRRKGISSTDAGHEKAIQLAGEVRDDLSALGFPLPLFGDSGNGTNFIYGIDLPNDVKVENPIYTSLVKDFVKGVAGRYGSPCEHGKTPYDDLVIHIDPVVFNPSRIGTVYGTWKRKGTSTEERPHRLSRIIESPEKLEPVPEDLLRLAIDSMKPVNKVTVAPNVGIPTVESTPASSAENSETDIPYLLQDEAERLDPVTKVVAKLKSWGLNPRTPIAKGVWTNIPIGKCLFQSKEHPEKATINVHDGGAISYGCFGGRCKGKDGGPKKTWADVRALYGDKDHGDEKDDVKPDPASVLVKIAQQDAKFWTTTNGEAYATMNIDGHRENRPLESSGFKNWLTGLAWEKKGKPAKVDHLNLAIGVLTHIARKDTRPVHLRYAHVDGRIYIDMGDAFWKIVEVGPDGWRIIQDAPVMFRRTPNTASLPEPQLGGSINLLRPFLATTDEAWPLFEGFILAAMGGIGPYFHLAISGEPGAAKSFANPNPQEGD